LESAGGLNYIHANFGRVRFGDEVCSRPDGGDGFTAQLAPNYISRAKFFATKRGGIAAVRPSNAITFAAG